MIKGEYEKLKPLADANLCAEHKAFLSVATLAEECTFVLRCAEGEYPDTLTRNPTPRELAKQGIELEPGTTPKAERERLAKLDQPNPLTVNQLLNLMPRTDLATGQMLQPAMIKALVDYADRYQLDAFRGHVVLMYGKPYITIDGYLFYGHQTKTAFSLGSRPLNETERKAYQIGEGDHAWLGDAILFNPERHFTGLGIVTQFEMNARSEKDNAKLRSPVVAAHPWQLAQKRAEWQALRRAFPIGETNEEADK